MRMHCATVGPEPLRGGLQAEKAPGGQRRECQGDRNIVQEITPCGLGMHFTHGFTGSVLSSRKDALIYATNQKPDGRTRNL